MREVKSGVTAKTPTRFVVTIGGFFCGHAEVRWRRGKLWYRHDRVDGSEVSVVPSAHEWETFWSAMDRISVWGWRRSYDNPDMLDGTQWSVEISDGVRRVRSFGSNLYPGGDNRETAVSFREFLEAVGVLLGRPLGR